MSSLVTRQVFAASVPMRIKFLTKLCRQSSNIPPLIMVALLQQPDRAHPPLQDGLPAGGHG